MILLMGGCLHCCSRRVHKEKLQVVWVEDVVVVACVVDVEEGCEDVEYLHDLLGYRLWKIL